jgi:hypothetical protein
VKKITTVNNYKSIKSKVIVKKLLCFLISIISVSGNLMSQGGQVHVNREWRDFTGNPVFNPLLNPFGLEWTKSIIASNNDLITVGHTAVTSQGENILLSRYKKDGTLIWQVDFNTAGTNNEYGIDVREDIWGDIYLVGTTDNGTTTNYDLVILAYNSSGSLLSATTHDENGLNDIGIALNFDSNGNIVVAASSENTSTSYDY